MRNIVALLVFGWAFTAVGQAIASERDDALETLAKAIKAHGGEEALAKAAQRSHKGSGTVTIIDKDLPFTEERVVALPDRMRFTVEVTVDKQKARITDVVNADAGWEDNGGTVMEMTKQRLEEVQAEAYVEWVALLTPLKKEADFQLAPLKPATINDHPAIGIKVSRKAQPEINLYFDKESGLLVKISCKARQAGIDVLKDYYFSDYKDVDGVRLPFQTIEMLNDKKFTELKIASYKLLGKADEKLFTKP